VDEFREPDFHFWPRAMPIDKITGSSALLIIEVADSGLRYDLETKAPVYGRLSVPE
jgi:Putative restriction endonuclease